MTAACSSPTPSRDARLPRAPSAARRVRRARCAAEQLGAAEPVVLCRRRRRARPLGRPRCPVIVLGQRRGGAARVQAFAAAATTTFARPFDYEELVARIRAVLRRCGRRGSTWSTRPRSIDRAARRVRRARRRVAARDEGVRAAPLPRPRARARVHEGELLRDVWGYRRTSRTRTLDSHASRVRRKLAGRPG